MAWVRIDDGFTEHRKVLELGVLGPLALALQLRACCWSARAKTQGHLPERVLRSLTEYFNRVWIARSECPEAFLATLRTHGEQVRASDLDWPRVMTSLRLWDLDIGGWQIHDFQTYNGSVSGQIAAGKNSVSGQIDTATRNSQSSSRVRRKSESYQPPYPPSYATPPITPSPAPAPTTTAETAPQGDGASGPAPKEPPHPVQRHDVRDAVKHWAAGFERTRGSAPPILWPRMCGQLAPVVKAVGLEGTCELLDRFFVSNNAEVRRSDYSPGAFIRTLYRLFGPATPVATAAGKTETMLQGLRNWKARQDAKRAGRDDVHAGDGETPRGLSTGRPERAGDGPAC